MRQLKGVSYNWVTHTPDGLSARNQSGRSSLSTLVTILVNVVNAYFYSYSCLILPYPTLPYPNLLSSIALFESLFINYLSSTNKSSLINQPINQPINLRTSFLPTYLPTYLRLVARRPPTPRSARTRSVHVRPTCYYYYYYPPRLHVIIT